MIRQETALFAKVHHKPPEPIHRLLLQRKLQPRDVAVMYCMIEFLDPTTGKVKLRPSAIAERLGLKPSNLHMTLKRLKEQKILVNRKERDTGEIYYLFCPQYVSIGSESKRSFLWKQFADAMQEEWDLAGRPPLALSP